MTYAYGTKGAPAVGGGLPGLPRRMESLGSIDIKIGEYFLHKNLINNRQLVRNGAIEVSKYPVLGSARSYSPPAFLNVDGWINSALASFSFPETFEYIVTYESGSSLRQISQIAQDSIVPLPHLNSTLPNRTFFEASSDGRQIIYGHSGATSGDGVGGCLSVSENLEISTAVSSFGGNRVELGVFAPNSRVFVFVNRPGVSSSSPRNVRLYRVDGSTLSQGNIPSDLPSNAVDTVCFSPKGDLLLVGGNFPERAILYSVSNLNLTKIRDFTSDFSGRRYGSAFSPDGKILVLSGTNGIKAFSIEDEYSVLYDFSDFTAGNGRNVGFSPDGKLLAIGGFGDDGFNVYRVQGSSFSRVNTEAFGSGVTGQVKFSPDGSLLFLGLPSLTRIHIFCTEQFYGGSHFQPAPTSTNKLGGVDSYTYVRAR